MSPWHDVLNDRVRGCVAEYGALAAAGWAFFATLGLVPAAGSLTTRAGAQFEPHDVDRRPPAPDDLLLPSACALWLISDERDHLVIRPRAPPVISLAIGVLQTFWGATVGGPSTLSALTVGFDGRPRRHVLRLLTLSLMMTLLDVLVSVLAMAVPRAAELAVQLERLSAFITTNPATLMPREADGVPAA